MKNRWLFTAVTAVLLINGCSLDSVKDKVDELKNRFEEYIDAGEERGERPFEVVYQNSENHTPIISANCGYNASVGYVHFLTQSSAARNYFKATRNLYSYPNRGILKPFWDIRYTNPVTLYLNGGDGSYLPNHAIETGLDARTGTANKIVGTDFSQKDPSGHVVQSECVNGLIAGGTTLNLYDAPVQNLVYAGIASTFVYQIHDNSNIFPWQADGSGNLMLQASFKRPVYRNFEKNVGGSVVFNVMLYNKKLNKHLNYVIGIYAAGSAWTQENAGMKFDPTTNIVHIGSVVSDKSWWTTKSPKSMMIQEIFNTNVNNEDNGQWPEFFRVNISYNNLKAVLDELRNNPPPNVAGQNFGSNPEDWEVLLIGIQYELEEEGGKALLAGSFRGFEAGISRLPF